MPNYFSLIRKSDNLPAAFNKVDEEMCKHFEVPCDPSRYLAGWYGVIGTLAAVKGFKLGTPEMRAAVVEWFETPIYKEVVTPEVRKEYVEDMLRILDYLETHFTSDNWVSIGR